jgi:nucleoid-associated protein YgaU
MIKLVYSGAVIAALAVVPLSAMASGKSNGANQGNHGGTNPGSQTQGFGSATYTQEVVTVTQEVAQTMGNSGKAPPNARAAASNGVKTTTTTTTVVEEVTYKVDGPKGQIDQGNYTCDNCVTAETGRETVSETVEVSSTGPGNSAK